jgi:hypothetical protein
MPLICGIEMENLSLNFKDVVEWRLQSSLANLNKPNQEVACANESTLLIGLQYDPN